MREIREDSTPIIVRSDSPLRSVTITFLIRYFTVGGLERVVSTLANEYTQAGLLVRIVVLEPGKRNALLTELDPRVDVQMVHERGPGRVRRLRELTRDTIVHINFGDGRIHPWVRTCLFNRNVVVTYHSDYAHKRHKMTNRADRIFAGRVQEIVAVSRAAERFCVEDVGIPSHRVEVIENAVPHPPASVTPERGGATGLTAVAVANLYPHKNHETLIRGLGRAVRAGTDARLVVLGDGPCLAALYKLAREEGVLERLEWCGAIWKREIMLPLVAQADVFVSASRYEGMPLSVLEALGLGLPCVLSDITAHRETAGDASVYFPADDPEALADALGRVAADAETLTAMSAVSRERSRLFAPARQAGRYLKVYERVLEGVRR